MRVRCLLLVVGVLLAVAAGNSAAQQRQGPLTVISAQRAKSFATASSEFKARDEAADVVIVVRVGGLSREEFRQVRQDSIRVMAGDEELPPSVVLSGVVDGKAELKAVFVGPKAILDMQLVMGDYPPVKFTAEQDIAEVLR